MSMPPLSLSTEDNVPFNAGDVDDDLGSSSISICRSASRVAPEGDDDSEDETNMPHSTGNNLDNVSDDDDEEEEDAPGMVLEER